MPSFSSSELPVTEVTTPIYSYHNSESRSNVHLVGMIHVGEQQYYDQVQETIGALEDRDTIVHYEAIKRLPEERLAQLDVGTTSKIRRIRSFLERLPVIFEPLELVNQIDGLQYLETWEHHDAEEDDLARRMSQFSVLSMQSLSKFINWAVTAQEPAQRKKLATDLMASLEKRMTEPRAATGVAKFLLGGMDAHVLDYRNEIALEAIDAELGQTPDADIALIWGAGHLPGMSLGLEQRGYEKVDSRKLVAVHLDR